ncbi:MAG TPA: right-handed parallel beta-helix repeat-containing protein [Candidatus Polarisedimenticolia bacterium]|jgi:hypothetical protein
MRKRLILMMLLATLAGAPLGAAEGKIPLWMPTVITQPGHYVLTRDISATAGPAVSIQADGVTLDLNGHTINQPGATQAAIVIGGVSGSSKGIIIVNGKIQGGLHGIQYQPPDPQQPLSLSDLILSGQAQAAVHAAGFGQVSAQGIIIIGTLVGFELLGNVAGSPPPPIPPKAIIRNADIRAGGGIHCTGVTCSIRDLAFEHQPPDPTAVSPAINFNGADGSEALGIVIVNGMPPVAGITPCVGVVSSRGIVIAGGKFHGPGTTGGACIEVDSDSQDVVIQDNTLTGCGGDGIHSMGSNVAIQGIFINGGGGHGIFAGGTNVIIDDGKLTANAGAGIWFETTGHVYRGNILRGNLRGAVDGPGVTGAVDGGGNIP